LPRLVLKHLVQTGQHRGPAPVVYHSVASVYMVIVGSHHDHRIRISRQFANDVRLLQSFDRLLGEFFAGASRLFEQTLQSGLTPAVVSFVALQPRLKHFAIDHVEVQLSRSRHGRPHRQGNDQS